MIHAERLAQALGDRPRIARASAFLCTSFQQTGDYDHSVESGERAAAIGKDLKNKTLASEMDFRLGTVYWALGDYARAHKLLRRCTEARNDESLRDKFAPPFQMSLLAGAWLGMCCSETGDFSEGINTVQAAVPLAEESNQPVNLAAVYLSLALLHVRQGRARAALPVLERAFALSEAKSLYLYTPILESVLGLARCEAGLLSDGIQSLKESARAAERARESQQLHQFASPVFANVSEGLLICGFSADALDMAARALDLAQAKKERGNEVWALHLLGEINGHPGVARHDTAEGSYQEALAAASGLGMRPLVARCHFGLGKLYGRLGQSNRARISLDIAVSLFQELDMQSFRDRTEVALRAF